MSEYTPGPKARSDGQAPVGLPRTALSQGRQKRRPAWLLLSIAVHVIVVGASVGVVVREREPVEKRHEERTMATERVEKIAEQIRDINAEELRANVIALIAIKGGMDTIMGVDGGVYEGFATDQTQRDPAVAQAHLTTAAEAVAQAAAAVAPLQQVREELAGQYILPAAEMDAAKQTELSAREKRLRHVAYEAMETAETAMTTAHAELGWVATPELAARQGALVEQLSATRASVNASSQAFDSLRRQREYRDKDTTRIAEAESRVATVDARVAEITALIAGKRVELAAANADLEAKEGVATAAAAAYATAEKALDEARKAGADTDKRKALDQAKDQARKAKGIADNAVKTAAKTAGGLTNSLKREEDALTRTVAALGREGETLADRQASFETRQTQIAEGRQQVAATATEAVVQSAALSQDTAAMAAAAATYLDTAEPRTVTAPEPLPTLVEPGELYDMNLAELYAAADGLEAQIVDEYRTIRGLRLSMLRALALEAAIPLIDAPKPMRLVIADELLTGSPKTAAALEAQKSAIRDVLAEGDTIEAYCLSLLESLRLEMEDASVSLAPPPEMSDSSTTEAATDSMTEVSEHALTDILAQIRDAIKQAIDQGEDVQDAIDKAVEVATNENLDMTVTAELQKQLENAADKAIEEQTQPETETTDPVAEVTTEPETPTEPETESTEPVATTETEPETETTESVAETETTTTEGDETTEGETESTTTEPPKTAAEIKAAQDARKQADGEAQADAKVAMKDATDSVFSKVLAEIQSETSDGTAASTDAAQAAMEARLAKTRAMELASSATTARAVDLSGLMKMSAAELKQAMDAAAAGMGSGAGESTMSESAAAPGAGMAMTQEMLMQYIKLPTDTPPLDKNTEGLVWGRKIRREVGTPASWMVLDSWYVIGPWDNPNRANRDRKFPPENIIDLDATYIGRANQPLTWQFVQVTTAGNSSNLIPPNPQSYAIYYFYTEVDVEDDMDLWIATGSDDKSKIWLNDMLVWESGPWHKNWRINEGFRKVHFRAGRNRILYRLENGQHGTAMSMLIRAAPWDDAPAQ